jgi:TonB family protein
MFENSLIDLGDKGKKIKSRRWLSLPVAVGLHLGLAATVAFAAYWNIAEVTEPEVNVVFFARKELPPPGPPAPPAGASVRTPQQAAPPRVVEPEQPVQPSDVPDDVPPAAAPPVPVTTYTGPVEGTGAPSAGGGSGGPEGGAGDGGCVGPLCGDGPPSPVPVVAPPPSDEPLPVGGAVTKPEAIYKVKPAYTEGARRIRLAGVVIVQAVIDEQGRVVDVRLVKGLPMGLDRSAMDAVKQWRFTAATRHGRPVKAYFNLTVRFEVQ